ncbi:MAG TPA: glycosyltransferase family 2 protein, partial [Candidatus Omnitrophota bacterium]|nr:glycosyltransferase family 2 protein [Candidatus Omnitrophota bacterium]
MRGPLISVLMALYNGGEYLKQSIKSVLDQTHDDFEFLIVNDCSTDDSLKIIESFHDKRIKVHNNAKNLGQTPSLNIGLKLARGDYFARMDADDVAFPQWIQSQVNYVEKHPGYSVVSSYAVAIDEENKIKKLYKPPQNKEDIILRSL